MKWVLKLSCLLRQLSCIAELEFHEPNSAPSRSQVDAIKLTTTMVLTAIKSITSLYACKTLSLGFIMRDGSAQSTPTVTSVSNETIRGER